jgi:uncharacterized protein YoxC
MTLILTTTVIIIAILAFAVLVVMLIVAFGCNHCWSTITKTFDPISHTTTLALTCTMCGKLETQQLKGEPR